MEEIRNIVDTIKKVGNIANSNTQMQYSIEYKKYM